MKTASALLFLIFTLTLLPFEASAISVAARSTKDYRFTMETLRQIKPMVENFKTEEIAEKYEEIKKAFEIASLEYFSRNYDSSAAKFYNLKLELMHFMETMAEVYIERTEELLSAATEENGVINIFIDYSRTGGYATYFNRTFDPLNDIPPYTEDFTSENFHLYWNKGSIERYLHGGYFHYQEAIRVKNDPVIEYIKSRRRIKSENINFVISRYIDAITLCRIAKEQGLEIYRVKNMHSEGAILDKYRLRQSQMTPIYDDRIPERFKVDAVDNRKLLYSVELEKRENRLNSR